MTKAKTTKANPDAVFGPDLPDEITYETIAEQIRRIQPAALSPEVHDDVLTMIVWLRDETIRLYDKNIELADSLSGRENALSEASAELDVRHKAVLAVISTDPDNKGWRKWA